MAHVFVPDAMSDSVLDISHWNGAVDFASLKREGILAVFIKATQGAENRDPAYVGNATAAQAAGMLWAPYHFLTSDTPNAQFTHLNATVPLTEGMVVMLDWEEEGVSVETVVALGQMVLNATKRPPVIYTGRYMLREPHPVLNTWPLMLAEWGPQAICPPGWDTWLIHQYTDKGQVHGIRGNVDRSVFAGTAAQLQEWWNTAATQPAETIVEEVIQVVEDVVDVVEDVVKKTKKKAAASE